MRKDRLAALRAPPSRCSTASRAHGPCSRREYASEGKPLDGPGSQASAPSSARVRPAGDRASANGSMEPAGRRGRPTPFLFRWRNAHLPGNTRSHIPSGGDGSRAHHRARNRRRARARTPSPTGGVANSAIQGTGRISNAGRVGRDDRFPKQFALPIPRATGLSELLPQTPFLSQEGQRAPGCLKRQPRLPGFGATPFPSHWGPFLASAHDAGGRFSNCDSSLGPRNGRRIGGRPRLGLGQKSFRPGPCENWRHVELQGSSRGVPSATLAPSASLIC